MPKAKVVKEALKQTTKRLGTGGKVGAGAVLAEKAVDTLDNPYLSAAEGAVIGGAAGSIAGPPGAIAGALAGGALGWILADNNTVVPVDMICIPAYQAYMIAGNPAFTIYVRAGETIIPTGGNVQDVNQALLNPADERLALNPPRKLSKWNKYVKNKKNHIRYKSGKNKGKLNLKAMAKKGGFGGRK